MELTHTVPLPVNAHALDLADWIFGMTDEEYQACARGHHAMGVIGGARRLGLVNVEQIATTLLIQHYATQVAEPAHVRFVSAATEGLLMRTVPTTVSVWWDMTIVPGDRSGSSELCCSIGFEAPAWVNVAGALIGNTHFLRKHLVEETAGFSRDITHKFGGDKHSRSGRDEPPNRPSML